MNHSSQAESPLVSIVIPVYNGAPFLSKTIESLRAQTFLDFEVIFVDDCSSDNSSRIISQYAAIDSRIILLSSAQNLGTAPAVVKNVALPVCRGTWFLYSSQDDLFETSWLEKLVARAAESDAQCVIADVHFFSECTGTSKSIIGLFGKHDEVISGKDAFSLSLSWTISANALWKLSLIRKVGYSDFNMYADEYSVRSFFLECEKVAFCDAKFYYRQDNPEAITKKLSHKTFQRAYYEVRLLQLAVKSGIVNNSVAVQLNRAIQSFYDLTTILRKSESTMTRPEIMLAWKSMEMALLEFNSSTHPYAHIKKPNRIKFFILRAGWNFFVTATAVSFLALKFRNRA